MSEGMIRNAITNLTSKYIPQPAANTSYTAPDAYRLLYPFLEVWDKQTQDPEIQERVQYIYNKLVDLNKEAPTDSLISILTKMGAVQFGESKLDKVYKYFHLNQEANKALKYHNLLMDELKNLEAKPAIEGAEAKTGGTQ